MTYNIRIGTINELTGVGEEWLVDVATRTYVIAKFFNGNFESAAPEVSTDTDGPTKVAL